MANTAETHEQPPTSAESVAKTKRAAADLQAFATALQMFKLNSGVFPTAKQGLASLVEKPKDDPIPRRWVQIMAKIPKDPWNRDYRYVTRNKDGKELHVIVSEGPNALSHDEDVEFVLEGAGK